MRHYDHLKTTRVQQSVYEQTTVFGVKRNWARSAERYLHAYSDRDADAADAFGGSSASNEKGLRCCTFVARSLNVSRKPL